MTNVADKSPIGVKLPLSVNKHHATRSIIFFFCTDVHRLKEKVKKQRMSFIFVLGDRRPDLFGVRNCLETNLITRKLRAFVKWLFVFSSATNSVYSQSSGIRRRRRFSLVLVASKVTFMI